MHPIARRFQHDETKLDESIESFPDISSEVTGEPFQCVLYGGVAATVLRSPTESPYDLYLDASELKLHQMGVGLRILCQYAVHVAAVANLIYLYVNIVYIMLADIFESAEFVRVIDFLLDDPDRDYTKSKIAEGAAVSRPTVYKIWDRLERLGVLKSVRKLGRIELYKVNRESPVVRSLLRFDVELSTALAEAGSSTPEPVVASVPTRRLGRK